MTNVSIIGVGQTDVREHWETSIRHLAWYAIEAALDDAHIHKIDAFLAVYSSGLSPERRAATADFFRAWNGRGDVAAAWLAFRAALPDLAGHAQPWAAEIASHGNLAENLVRFCLGRL